MSHQELRAMIRPDGLLLEWTDTTDDYPEPSRHFQQELYRRAHSHPARTSPSTDTAVTTETPFICGG